MARFKTFGRDGRQTALVLDAATQADAEAYAQRYAPDVVSLNEVSAGEAALAGWIGPDWFAIVVPRQPASLHKLSEEAKVVVTTARQALRTAFKELFLAQGESETKANKLADLAVGLAAKRAGDLVADSSKDAEPVAESKRGSGETFTVELHEMGTLVGGQR
jgi:hypothetical protein